MQITSCGLFEARKQQSYPNGILIHSMEKSIYIDSLSIDDNRNIKKLYSIMKLSKQRVTVTEFIIALKSAYEQL